MGLCKQQKLYADAKAIEKINFTGTLTRFGEAGIFFIIDEVKEPVLGFSIITIIIPVLRFYFVLIKH